LLITVGLLSQKHWMDNLRSYNVLVLKFELYVCNCDFSFSRNTRRETVKPAAAHFNASCRGSVRWVTMLPAATAAAAALRRRK